MQFVYAARCPALMITLSTIPSGCHLGRQARECIEGKKMKRIWVNPSSQANVRGGSLYAPIFRGCCSQGQATTQSRYKTTMDETFDRTSTGAFKFGAGEIPKRQTLAAHSPSARDRIARLDDNGVLKGPRCGDHNP